MPTGWVPKNLRPLLKPAQFYLYLRSVFLYQIIMNKEYHWAAIVFQPVFDGGKIPLDSMNNKAIK